jgi:hypothetical protein
MGHTDVSEILLNGMSDTLEVWAGRLNGEDQSLFWLLRIKVAEIREQDVEKAIGGIPDTSRDNVLAIREGAHRYWDDIRYSALEPVTQLWGTIVNAVRVTSQSTRVTDSQKQVFAFPNETLVAFFRAARDRMEVADSLYHAFKAMPAPECQALAALLNVHVDAPLDANTMCRLVRLLDHEGPMSEEETRDLAAISNTHLVNAAFSGLRANA